MICFERDSTAPALSARYTGVYVLTMEDRSLVAVGPGIGLPARFRIDRDKTTATVTYNGTTPTVDVHVRDANARVLDRLHLQSLVEQATAALVYTTGERPPDPEVERVYPGLTEKWREKYGDSQPVGAHAGSDSHDVVAAVRRMYRSKVTADDIARAADAYENGGIAAVKNALLVGDRQAWRYVQRAQQAGLAERIRQPRKAKQPCKNKQPREGKKEQRK
jgi:hypothetical protein